MDKCMIRDTEEIQKKVQTILGDDVSVQVVSCKEIRIEENGKYKVVKSSIK